MTKYILVYTGGGMPETEEESAKVMAAWGAWYGGLGEAVIDPGNPFTPAVMNLTSDGTVNAGAFGTQASGYSILEAESMEHAVGMAKKCPMLEGNGQITVYEAGDM